MWNIIKKQVQIFLLSIKKSLLFSSLFQTHTINTHTDKNIHSHLLFLFVSHCLFSSSSPFHASPRHTGLLYLGKCYIINWGWPYRRKSTHNLGCTAKHTNPRTQTHKKDMRVYMCTLCTFRTYTFYLFHTSLLLLFCTQHAYILSDLIIHVKSSLGQLPSEATLLPQLWSQTGSHVLYFIGHCLFSLFPYVCLKWVFAGVTWWTVCLYRGVITIETFQ